MGARNARSRALAVIGLVCVIVFAVAGAHAALTVHDDVAAWRESQAAFKRLFALSAYRMKVTSSNTSIAQEIVRPDSFHSVNRTTTGRSVQTDEYIGVNGQIRKRTISATGAPAEWQCLNVPTRPVQNGPSRFDPFNPLGSNRTVDVARGPDAAIDGTPVRTYQYIFHQADTPLGPMLGSKDTLYVGKASGLPRRIVNVIDGANDESITDFYDYGAHIVITLPPCK